MVRYLVHIQFQTADKCYNRTLMSDSVPSEYDMKEYYKVLCGFQDIELTLKVEEVSDLFNESMLPQHGKAPSSFPACNLVTDVGDAKKRADYNTYIQRLCEMEEYRIKLEFSKPTTATGADSDDSETDEVKHAGRINLAKMRQRAWVEDLLKALNPRIVEDDSLMEIVVDSTIPQAWVFTPTVTSQRDISGSRIIMNTVFGKKWEACIGTDMYPDFIMTQRISAANWLFKHATTETVVLAVMNWYIASQDTKLVNGVSDWILRADMDIYDLFKPFRSMSIHDKFVMSGSNANPKAQALRIINDVETKCLGSNVSDGSIHPVSLDTFRRYMTYVFRGYSFNPDTYLNMETATRIFDRWVRSSCGFLPKVTPVHEKWGPLWLTVMRGKPTSDNVLLFLKTMDCWDPINIGTLSEDDLTDLGKQWINIYFDNELIVEHKMAIRTVFLHEKLREWCFKWLPESLMDKKLRSAAIASALSLRGHASSKRNSGRFTLGLRFKDKSIIDPTIQHIKKTTLSTNLNRDEAADIIEAVAENTIDLGRV